MGPRHSQEVIREVGVSVSPAELQRVQRQVAEERKPHDERLLEAVAERGTADKDGVRGKQGSESFLEFRGEPFVQSRRPAAGITHKRVPSHMELCLLLEESLFDLGLWHPLDKKDFGSGYRYRVDKKKQAHEFAERRTLLFEMARFVHGYNESLHLNQATIEDALAAAIDEGVAAGLSHVSQSPFPSDVCSLIASYLRADYFVSHKEQSARMRPPPTLGSQKHNGRTKNTHGGLFWDFNMYADGEKGLESGRVIGSVFDDFHRFVFNPENDEDLISVPSSLIRPFEDTGIRYVCANIFVNYKSDEMWIGPHRFDKLALTNWPRIPKVAVYYYGGRNSAMIRMRSRVVPTGLSHSKPDGDGCWGMVQCSAEGRTQKLESVFLPYYQSGDWLSFKVDTKKRCFDLFLNNELIVQGVDCTALPMPWTLVGVVDRPADLLFVEQCTDMAATTSPFCIDATLY